MSRNEVVHLKIVGGINNRFECLSHENLISVLVLTTQVHSVNNTQQVLDYLRAWHQKHCIRKKKTAHVHYQSGKTGTKTHTPKAHLHVPLAFNMKHEKRHF